jgi:hypothetical protein
MHGGRRDWLGYTRQLESGVTAGIVGLPAQRALALRPWRGSPTPGTWRLWLRTYVDTLPGMRVQIRASVRLNRNRRAALSGMERQSLEEAMPTEQRADAIRTVQGSLAGRITK